LSSSAFGFTPRGLFLDPAFAPFGKVDGILSLGVSLTPSLPAVGEIKPVPPCRVNFISQHARPAQTD
jgi:hypothetical protein